MYQTNTHPPTYQPTHISPCPFTLPTHPATYISTHPFTFLHSYPPHTTLVPPFLLTQLGLSILCLMIILQGEIAALVALKEKDPELEQSSDSDSSESEVVSFFDHDWRLFFIFDNEMTMTIMCSSRKYLYPQFCFRLGQAPPGKDIYVKNYVTLYYYAKVNCFCDKERKNPFIHVNTVSDCLNFAFFLSQLIIKGKSMRNMEAIPYTTKQRTSQIQTKHQEDFQLKTCQKKAQNTATLR